MPLAPFQGVPTPKPGSMHTALPKGLHLFFSICFFDCSMLSPLITLCASFSFHPLFTVTIFPRFRLPAHHFCASIPFHNAHTHGPSVPQLAFRYRHLLLPCRGFTCLRCPHSSVADLPSSLYHAQAPHACCPSHTAHQHDSQYPCIPFLRFPFRVISPSFFTPSSPDPFTLRANAYMAFDECLSTVLSLCHAVALGEDLHAIKKGP